MALTPVLTKRFGTDQPWKIENYERLDGYAALRKALTMRPDDLIALVVGAVLLSMSARNWRPNSRSWTQLPSAVTHSPALTEAREPTTTTKSRCPFAFTLSTAQPFSSLKNVTRSIRPERLSWGRADGCSVRNGSDCGCTVSDWQGRLVPATLRPCQSTNCALSTSLPAYGLF